MKTTSWVIYGLRLDQPDSQYRYIGITKRRLSERFDGHTRSARTGNPLPVYRWMRKNQGGVIIEVIEQCPPDDYDFLLLREVFWIKHYRELNGDLGEEGKPDYLLNVADGGRGCPGTKWPEERKAEYSARLTGGGNPNYGKPKSPESRAKQSASITGELHWNYGRNWSKEYKEKQRLAHVGQPGWNKGMKFGPHSEEHRRKISESAKGRKDKPETVEKRRAALTGKKRSDEAKENYRQSALNRPRVVCPHCGKESDASNGKRWHFDNCKQKP